MSALTVATEEPQGGLGGAMLLRALVEMEQVNPDGCVVLRAIRDNARAIVDFEFIFSNDVESMRHVQPGLLVGRRLSEAAHHLGPVADVRHRHGQAELQCRV
ncbi:MAG: hypothetical protein ACXU86_23835, partial [Archangium sp.]